MTGKVIGDRERGQMPSATVLVVAALATGALAVIFVPFGQGGNAQAEARTGADAAALAGAEAMRDQFPASLRGWLNGNAYGRVPAHSGASYAAASRFAGSNGGRLTQFSTGDGTVSVTVEATPGPEGGGPKVRTATASMGLAPGSCHVVGGLPVWTRPTPTPTPTPTPSTTGPTTSTTTTTTTPPGPPPGSSWTVRCGGVDIPIVFDVGQWQYRPAEGDEHLKSRLKVHLVA